MAEIARKLTIHGRVQGVFYRDWAVKTAGELGLAGWIRNQRNGTVEALIEGNEKVVARFLELAAHGPPAAEVERIDQEPHELKNLDVFRRC